MHHRPTELPQVRQPLAALQSPPVDSSKDMLRCPTLPFAPVEDDPDIAPVLKVLAQLFVSV